jgi:hypothetical protein
MQTLYTPFKKLLLLIAPAALLLFPATVHAEIPGAMRLVHPIPSGITVSPYNEQLMLTAGQQTASYNITVTNNYASPVLIELKVVDFTNINETGQLRFYTPQEDATNPYSLKNNVSFKYSNVVVGAYQSEQLPVTINNASQLAAGGHFGAILLQVDNTAGDTGNNVTINQASASLLFVSTEGQGTQNVQLATPLLGKVYTNLPTSLNAVFSDTGNTQTVPDGVVQLYGPKNHLLSQTQLNTNSDLVLPYSKRLYTIELNTPTGHLWPGRYTLKVTYGYGSTQKTYSETFLYISTPVIVFSTIFIILLYIAIVNYKNYLPQLIDKTRQSMQKKKPVATVDKKKTKKQTKKKIPATKSNSKKIEVTHEENTYKIK